ncbi:MAG: hypothetical protein QM538_03895, partial [Methylacidiphilales bacterium]|nr:hypothetical protein [Candidatus Methylacidiphilales bacterium]
MFNKSLYYDASLVIVNILDVLLGFVIALTIVVSFFLALSKSLVVVNYSIYNSVSPLKHGTVLFWNIKIFLTRLFLLFMFIFDCTINHRSKSTLIRSDSTIVGSRLYLKLIGLDLLLFFNITLICILFFILYLFIYI